MKALRYAICDVFTDSPLCGNPLAVFTDARALDASTMQRLAREMNLSETTFVLPPERGGHARVRIFMPTRELPFAGHPTLGTAFVLGAPLELSELRLELPVGIVPVRLEREGARLSFGWMTQPVPRETPVGDVSGLLRALGVEATAGEIAAYDNGPRHVFVPLPTPEHVARAQPDLSALARATPHGTCLYCFDGQTCRMRYFAPAAGVNEDPATGSAAGPLALHLLRAGRLSEGAELVIDQGREISRPSTIHARVALVDGEPVVEVGGRARVVARGQFTL